MISDKVSDLIELI